MGRLKATSGFACPRLWLVGRGGVGWGRVVVVVLVEGLLGRVGLGTCCMQSSLGWSAVRCSGCWGGLVSFGSTLCALLGVCIRSSDS